VPKATQITNATKVTLQNEIITDHIYDRDGYQLTGSTIQPRVSYPRMHITHPWVPDETGFMRFRYIARMNAATHMKIHLVPDHVNQLYPHHVYPENNRKHETNFLNRKRQKKREVHDPTGSLPRVRDPEMNIAFL